MSETIHATPPAPVTSGLTFVEDDNVKNAGSLQKIETYARDTSMSAEAQLDTLNNSLNDIKQPITIITRDDTGATVNADGETGFKAITEVGSYTGALPPITPSSSDEFIEPIVD